MDALLYPTSDSVYLPVFIVLFAYHTGTSVAFPESRVQWMQMRRYMTQRHFTTLSFRAEFAPPPPRIGIFSVVHQSGEPSR